MRKKIASHGNSAALLVPREFLAETVAKDGDEVQVTMIDHTSLSELSRRSHETRK
ncbi:MAG TPA: hypothetical protein VGV87_16065 [Blastocatellia bacterium]|jgi:antitoxin component of MazEF toxin-antitoxin module|nr:hypothetical protein [Blastocatellia bacterium]